MKATTRIAIALAEVLQSANAELRMQALLTQRVEIFDHEGEDNYVDINLGDKGYRIQVQGPFDVD